MRFAMLSVRVPRSFWSTVPAFLLISVEPHQSVDSSVHPLDLTAMICHFHPFHARKLPRDGVVIEHLQEKLDV
jgi:hypothetical protein